MANPMSRPRMDLPTINVPSIPAGGNISKSDMIQLFNRDAVLARSGVPVAPSQAQPQAPGPKWAQNAHTLVTSTTSNISDVASKVSKVTKKVFTPDWEKDDPNILNLKGSLVIQKKILALDLSDLLADAGDDVTEVLGQNVTIQIVSTTVDPKTGKGAVSHEVEVEHWIDSASLLVPANITFDLDFQVPKNFGVPGAVIVKNRHPHEFLLVSFSIEMPDKTVVNFASNSWIFNTDFKDGRILFSNQVYLPSETPEGLVGLREQELKNLRGDGTGERKLRDRIYDYATYNDLGDPDAKSSLKRPILGGTAEYPYPRRIRTGRPPTKKDPTSESRGGLLDLFYIPRDEIFEEIKQSDFSADAVKSTGHRLVNALKAEIDQEPDFSGFADIRSLYGPKRADLGGKNTAKPNTPNSTGPPFLSFVQEFVAPGGEDTNLLVYPLPDVIAGNEQAWSQDDEFARQLIAGINPLVIELLQEFPIKSKLEAATYGDPVSAITSTHIENKLDGLTIEESCNYINVLHDNPENGSAHTPRILTSNMEQALAQKKLFVLDYNDIFLPYVGRINDLKTSATYASRTLLFLTSEGILTPLAIELTLPPTTAGSTKTSRVFTPPSADESTENWVWELAKAHVNSNDASFHQVVSHWMRTHATMEPFIIATNRQLSALHPVHQLLVPHHKNTMDINGAARKALINAGGIVETTFTPARYAMEMSSVVYGLTWRFDEQALPADLIKRGMAVQDANAPYGLKLVIEDYPYAADGLELWDALKTYSKDHLSIFYSDDVAVQQDNELQNWWKEVRTVGHADKKEGWPELNSIESLVQIVTTISWIASCHHAAVNFGQYAYEGFMPNRPTMSRKLIPENGSKEWDELQANPEKFYMETVSNESQATVVMATIEILSTHSSDEEYLGQRTQPNWSNDEKILAAFGKFSKKIGEIEQLIDGRNADKTLKNRFGSVQIAYELLKPTSGQGLTGKGVPTSVSI